MRPALPAILAATRERLAGLGPRAGELRAAARDAPAAPPWATAFTGSSVAVVAEIKRRSPSAGVIADILSPVGHARDYVTGGAAAVSVLTEEKHFGGSLQDLSDIAGAVPVPVLRKDFIVDPVQVYEARVGGASAVLLIVRVLEQSVLEELAGLAAEVQLGTLIEVHDAVELERALRLAPETVGVNARDLETFVIDAAATEAVLRAVPPQVVAIAESGLAERADVERVAAWGADAVLVGTALAGARNPAAAVQQLVGVRRVRRPAPARAGREA